MVSSELVRRASRSRAARSAPAAPSQPLPIAEPRTTFFRDRRAGVERVIELTRWIVLVYAAVANNFPGVHTTPQQPVVNLVLGGWGVFNLTATIMLVARRFPGKRAQLAMMGVDLGVASALVYLTGGFQSDLAVAFYLVVIASSLRFRVAGSMLCTLVAGGLYFAMGFAVA